MKKVIVVLISVMFSGSMLFGQNTEFDSRLLVKYSVEELNKIEKENPSEMRFLLHCIENAQYITPFPEGKEGAVEIIGEVEIRDINNINFFELDVELIQDNYQYYTIEGSEMLLVIKSKDHILKTLK
jgi:hypothetical protein